MRDIFFCCYTYGNFDHVINTVQAHKLVAIIFPGDLQAKKPLQDELRMILDDTDFDADHDNLFISSLAPRNLHAKAVDMAGVRIAGLGGVFRGRVWLPPGDPVFASPCDLVRSVGSSNLWRNGLMRKLCSTIFPVDYFRLMGKRADVLVTHEAASVHQHGWDAVDALASSLRMRKFLYGHHEDHLYFLRGPCSLLKVTPLAGSMIDLGQGRCRMLCNFKG